MSGSGRIAGKSPSPNAIRIPVPHLGLATFQPLPTALGAVLITGAKLWYIDRMAVLYDDMVGARPELRYRGTP